MGLKGFTLRILLFLCSICTKLWVFVCNFNGKKTRLFREMCPSVPLLSHLSPPPTPFMSQPFQSFLSSLSTRKILFVSFPWTCHWHFPRMTACSTHWHPILLIYFLPLSTSSCFKLRLVFISCSPELAVDCLCWIFSPETNPQPGISMQVIFGEVIPRRTGRKVGKWREGQKGSQCQVYQKQFTRSNWAVTCWGMLGASAVKPHREKQVYPPVPTHHLLRPASSGV